MADASLDEMRAKIPELIALRDAATTRKERRALAERVRLLRAVILWREGNGWPSR